MESPTALRIICTRVKSVFVLAQFDLDDICPFVLMIGAFRHGFRFPDPDRQVRFRSFSHSDIGKRYPFSLPPGHRCHIKSTFTVVLNAVKSSSSCKRPAISSASLFSELRKSFAISKQVAWFHLQSWKGGAFAHTGQSFVRLHPDKQILGMEHGARCDRNGCMGMESLCWFAGSMQQPKIHF
jgi:hypothetical protein